MVVEMVEMVVLDHLEEAVATATAPQGLGAGWDHVLLLLRHSQWELGTDHTSWSATQENHAG